LLQNDARYIGRRRRRANQIRQQDYQDNGKGVVREQNNIMNLEN